MTNHRRIIKHRDWLGPELEMKQVSIWIKATNGFESEEMEFVVNFATVVKKVEGVTRKWNPTSFYSFNPAGTVTCPSPMSEFIQVLLFPEAGEESRNWNFLRERSGVDSTPLPRSTFDSVQWECESRGLRISNRSNQVITKCLSCRTFDSCSSHDRCRKIFKEK